MFFVCMVSELRQHMDFANSSKEEILTFLDGVSHGDLANCDSFPSLEELNEDDEQVCRFLVLVEFYFKPTNHRIIILYWWKKTSDARALYIFSGSLVVPRMFSKQAG